MRHSFSLGGSIRQNEQSHCQHVCEMFHSVSHQGYMVELTTHQGSVGRVLRAGAALLAEGNLSEEEDSEVREQMNLLNSRWEHLRVASMERQSRYIYTLSNVLSHGSGMALLMTVLVCLSVGPPLSLVKTVILNY